MQNELATKDVTVGLLISIIICFGIDTEIIFNFNVDTVNARAQVRGGGKLLGTEETIQWNAVHCLLFTHVSACLFWGCVHLLWLFLLLLCQWRRRWSFQVSPGSGVAHAIRTFRIAPALLVIFVLCPLRLQSGGGHTLADALALFFLVLAGKSALAMTQPLSTPTPGMHSPTLRFACGFFFAASVCSFMFSWKFFCLSFLFSSFFVSAERFLFC